MAFRAQKQHIDAETRFLLDKLIEWEVNRTKNQKNQRVKIWSSFLTYCTNSLVTSTCKSPLCFFHHDITNHTVIRQWSIFQAIKSTVGISQRPWHEGHVDLKIFFLAEQHEVSLPGKWKRLSSGDKIISLRLMLNWSSWLHEGLNLKKSWKTHARCKKLAANTWRLFLRRPWLEGMSPIAISLENEPKKLKTLLCFMCQSLLTGWIGRDEKGREAPGRRFKIISTLPLDNSVFFHKFSQFWFVLILVPLWPQLLVDFDFGLFCCFYMVEDMRLWCIAWVTVSSEAFWTVWFLLIRWCCVTLVSLRAAVSSAVKCISKIVRGKVFTPSL